MVGAVLLPRAMPGCPGRLGTGTDVSKPAENKRAVFEIGMNRKYSFSDLCLRTLRRHISFTALAIAEVHQPRTCYSHLLS